MPCRFGPWDTCEYGFGHVKLSMKGKKTLFGNKYRVLEVLSSLNDLE